MSNANLFSYHSLSSQPDAKYTGVVSITGETTSFSYQNLATPSHQPPPITVSDPNPKGGSGALLDPTAILSPPNSSNKSYFSASVGAQLIALLNLVAYQQSESSYVMEKAQAALIFQTFEVSQQNARLLADQAKEDIDKYIAQLAGGMLQMAIGLSMIGLSLATQLGSKIHAAAAADRKRNAAIVGAATTTSIPPVSGPPTTPTTTPTAPAVAPTAPPATPAAPGSSSPPAPGTPAPPVDASTGSKPGNKEVGQDKGDGGDSGTEPTSMAIRTRLEDSTPGADLTHDGKIRTDSTASATADAKSVATLSSSSVESDNDAFQANADGMVPSSQAGLAPMGRRVDGAPDPHTAAPMVAADNRDSPASISRTIVDVDKRASTQAPQSTVAAPLAASPTATQLASSLQSTNALPPSATPSNVAAVNAVIGVPPSQQVQGTQTGSHLGSGAPSSSAARPLNSTPFIDAAGPPVAGLPTASAQAATGATGASPTAGTGAATGTGATSSAASAAAAGGPPPGKAAGFEKSDGIDSKEVNPKRWYEQLAEATGGLGGQAIVEASKSMNIIMTQVGMLNYLSKIGDIQKAQATAQEYEKMLETSTQLYQTAVQDMTRELQTTLDNIKQIAEQTKKMTSIEGK